LGTDILLRAIGGTIVYKNDFKIGEGLVTQRG
jgi:hypothetical protein